MRTVSCYCAVLLSALVAACSIAPQRELPDADATVLWAQRMERLQAIDSWQFNGRVAIRESGDRSRSVHLHWHQQHDRFEIAFLSLLGRRVAELDGGPGDVVLRLPDEEPVTASDSGTLLESTLGWTAPVDSLRFWVRGLPDPGQSYSVTELDPWGRIVRLQQDDWTVDFDDYAETGGVELPRRLTASHPRVRLRLIVDDWQLEQVDDR